LFSLCVYQSTGCSRLCLRHRFEIAFYPIRVCSLVFEVFLYRVFLMCYLFMRPHNLKRSICYNWYSFVRDAVCPFTALVRDPAEVLPKAAYEPSVSALNTVQVFVFERCILNSNTLFRPWHNSISIKYEFIAISVLCETFGSQHAVAVWDLSAKTRRQKRGLFLWNLSQRENPRVMSGGDVREEVCTLYRWGRGYAACSRKIVFVLGLMTSLSDGLWELVNSKGIKCVYCLVMRI
jgi:hypothetical protein